MESVIEISTPRSLTCIQTRKLLLLMDAPIIGIGRLSAVLPIISIGRLSFTHLVSTSFYYIVYQIRGLISFGECLCECVLSLSLLQFLSSYL